MARERLRGRVGPARAGRGMRRVAGGRKNRLRRPVPGRQAELPQRLSEGLFLRPRHQKGGPRPEKPVPRPAGRGHRPGGLCL